LPRKAFSGIIEHVFEPVAQVTAFAGSLAGLDRDLGDGQRIELVRALEELKAAAAAAQAVLTADFAASQRAEQLAAGVAPDLVGRGVGAQVALARRESPHRGSRLVGLARALVEEMPATMAALAAGRTTEWRATIIARESACLSRADRARLDTELGHRVESMSDRQVEVEARRIAYRCDPAAFTARTRGAVSDRRVTLRPAPDTMTRLTGFLPVGVGVAAAAALTREADRLRASGDPRTRGQLMADLMGARLTGRPLASPVVRAPSGRPAPTDAAAPTEDGGPAVAVEVQLVISAETLLGQGDEAALLSGPGVTPVPVPAPVARAMVRDSTAAVWLRRVFARPGDGALVAMESRRRRFPGGLRAQLVTRDQFCRTPWCGAPIRHGDHVTPVEARGVTSESNGQGLCEACNLTKQAPAWRADAGPGGAGEVRITTPTGHIYASHPPAQPGSSPRQPPDRSAASTLETRFREQIDLAWRAA
jgi:hypothetical protein